MTTLAAPYFPVFSRFLLFCAFSAVLAAVSVRSASISAILTSFRPFLRLFPGVLACFPFLLVFARSRHSRPFDRSLGFILVYVQTFMGLVSSFPGFNTKRSLLTAGAMPPRRVPGGPFPACLGAGTSSRGMGVWGGVSPSLNPAEGAPGRGPWSSQAG